MLLVSAILLFLTGVAHSYLGEKYILCRLFARGKLPPIFGNDDFTKRTLRFAWHLTTVAWWGFAAILFCLSTNRFDPSRVLLCLSLTFFSSSLLALGISRGKHLSWIIFLAVAILCFLARSPYILLP